MIPLYKINKMLDEIKSQNKTEKETQLTLSKETEADEKENNTKNAKEEPQTDMQMDNDK